MKAATRRKVSYVVNLCNEKQAHCLGVNSLAINTSTEGGVLYSAGRDGIIASWDLHLDLDKRKEEMESKVSNQEEAFEKKRNGFITCACVN